MSENYATARPISKVNLLTFEQVARAIGMLRGTKQMGEEVPERRNRRGLNTGTPSFR